MYLYLYVDNTKPIVIDSNTLISNIDIDRAILENIDIYINIDGDSLENIDINKGILQNIDINKIL